ncbi:MAG TPA: hypothetical protein VGC57_10690 [Cellulomonas sp.]
MQVGAGRLEALADDVTAAAQEVAPSALEGVVTQVDGALGGSQTARAMRSTGDALADRVRAWREGLAGWGESAQASADAYTAVDQRTRSRFDQVAR